MNRRTWIPMLFAVLAAPFAAHAQPQRVAAAAAGDGKLAAAQLVTVTAKVDAIDLAKREVTLRHGDGHTESLLVSEEVKNLPQVKVGDTVSMEYYESLTLSLNKTEGVVPPLSERASEQRAELGQLPGGIRTNEITAVAKVTAIDAAKSEVTLTGPRGNSLVLEVPADALAKVKVGDHVMVVYTQAVAIGVTRAGS